MTIAACNAYCAAGGYSYSGLEYGQVRQVFILVDVNNPMNIFSNRNVVRA